jgi:phage replication O-like protein O
MAAPDLDNGYTRIANELLEAIIRYHCSCGEKDIILSVIRATYGFNRKEHELSETKLAGITKRHKNKIAVDLKSLMDKNIIKEIKPPTFYRGRILALNKNYDEWLTTTKTHTVNELTKGTVIGNTEGTVSENANPSINKHINKVNKPQRKTVSSDDYDAMIKAESIYEFYSQNVRVGARVDAIRNIKRILKEYSEQQLIDSINKYVSAGLSQEKQYRIQANNFFGKAARFLEYLHSSDNITDITLSDTVETDPEFIKWKGELSS